MSDLAFEILGYFKTNYQFNFDSDSSIKCQQENAIKELVDNGYLIVEAKSIGYVIAKVL